MTCYTLGFGMSGLLAAMFHWRTTLAMAIVSPIMTMIALCFCPETPVWLMRKGRKEQMFQTLAKLRGDQEVIKAEVSSLHLMILSKSKNQEGSKRNRISMSWSLITKKSFIKPFIICSLMMSSLSSTGFTTIGFYMVHIVEVSYKIKFDSTITLLYKQNRSPEYL